MRIAYLNGRSWRGRAMAADELPTQEQADFALLVAAGARRGMMFECAYWDDATLPERGFDAAIIRSCWDYTERSEEFLATLRRHESGGLRVFNSADVVQWNARKTYLKELGALTIPTFWSEKFDEGEVARAFDALGSDELVVKPQVGAGARRTIRLGRDVWRASDLSEAPIGPAMAQPYLKSIEDEGERSLFWFGGQFAHAIRKVPQAGAWLANQPQAARFFAEAAPREALEVAEEARALAPRDLLYVRIDLVRDDEGIWRVIEIEAIEPYLFLAFAPEAADVFVDAVARALAP